MVPAIMSCSVLCAEPRCQHFPGDRFAAAKGVTRSLVERLGGACRLTAARKGR